MKTLLALLLSFSLFPFFLNSEDLNAKVKLKKINKSGYETYDYYVDKFNNWHDDTAKDESCANIPILEKTALIDVVDCIYNSELKYFQRNDLDFNSKFTDTIYEWYSTNFERAKRVHMNWISDTSNYESELKSFLDTMWYEYESMHLYLSELFAETLMKEQLKINANKNSDTQEDDSFIKMCKSTPISELDKDVAMLCLEKLSK